MGDDTSAIIHKHGGVISPRSFRLAHGAFVPYEFDFSDLGSLLRTNTAFLSDLASLLCQHNSDSVLGLRVLDECDSGLTVEVSKGNANIMMPRGNVPEEELIQALWVFGKDADEACHCKEVCRVDSKGTHFESNHTCG